MSKYFFDVLSNQSALRLEVARWKGTPFAPHAGASARRGAGADCVSFVAHALMNIGAIKPFAWPKYVVSGGGEKMLELLVKTLAQIPEMERVATLLPGDERPALKVGDVLLISSGRAAHHISVYVGDNTIWHCNIESRGVGSCNVHDPVIMDNLKAVYRVRLPEQAQQWAECKTCKNN